jgi:hypothetical protein
VEVVSTTLGIAQLIAERSGGAAMADHRFPPPWRVDKMPGGYVVRDATGQALAYVYSRLDKTEAIQAKTLTADEGRRIAANIARLPELLGTGRRKARSAFGSTTKTLAGRSLLRAFRAGPAKCPKRTIRHNAAESVLAERLQGGPKG